MTYTYQATEFDEMLSVNDAIRFERQLLGDLDDIDIRYNSGYIDGVVATMAVQDPFLEDAGDIRLMRQIVKDQRLNINGSTDRKHAYLYYIRVVAAILEARDAKV